MVDRTIALLEASNFPMVNSCGERMRVLAASWRSGGVRTAVDAGVPEYLIKQYGRWTSDAWKNYLCSTPLDLLGSSRLMFSSSLSSVVGSNALLVGDPVAVLLEAKEDDEVVVRRASVALNERVLINYNLPRRQPREQNR
jgi:hypothetical protein